MDDECRVLRARADLQQRRLQALELGCAQRRDRRLRPDEGFAYEIHTVRIANPEIKWDALALPSVASLISQVSDGTIGTRSSARLRHRSRATSISISTSRSRRGQARDRLGGPPRFAELKSDLDAFIARLRRDGTLARLADRYMPDPRQIQRIDAGALQEKIRTVLPQYKSLFHDAQEKSGIEWRLLAAIAYQESQWDPGATSSTAFEASCRSPRTPPGILGSAI
jgi:hypothetical protein